MDYLDNVFFIMQGIFHPGKRGILLNWKAFLDSIDIPFEWRRCLKIIFYQFENFKKLESFIDFILHWALYLLVYELHLSWNPLYINYLWTIVLGANKGSFESLPIAVPHCPCPNADSQPWEKGFRRSTSATQEKNDTAFQVCINLNWGIYKVAMRRKTFMFRKARTLSREQLASYLEM